ncbi:Nuclease-related domain-containing protein [Fibrobacter sp. UWR3]|uniref:nuclease-related domain-containing protein n=1 Tax=Fibrobacter sp. UWR3 TaxID=1896217 RepID=UPI00091696CD|nr:nuclease-related domain-containing protein [Fibrobacter sp. UWR3]SHN10707.1 Nuclease-related domain-containing protein [Fibrobacter sp. UWR3]
MITFIVILGAIVFCMWFFQNQIVGHIGEKHTANRIRAISKGTVFRDVYVEGSHGVQQIDIIAVTEKGILVVEKKTYIGLIVGNAYDKQWTVIAGWGKKKYSMKNPHHQNYGHIMALHEMFPALKDKFIDLVIFGNNAKLGDRIPEGTIRDRDFKKYYKALPTKIYPTEIEAIAREIASLNADRARLKAMHKEKIKGMKKK